MSNPFSDSNANPNPYVSPQYAGGNPGPQTPNSNVSGKVLPPAIFMLAIAGLCLVFGLIGFANAVLVTPLPVDPNAPPIVQEFAKGQYGPIAATVQGLAALAALVTIIGSVQMIRQRSRPLAYVAAVLSMINFGNFCCVLGLPAGIWAVIILSMPDVAAAFQRKS
jgi:hypothetical protein